MIQPQFLKIKINGNNRNIVIKNYDFPMIGKKDNSVASIDSCVGISRSVSKTDDRFYSRTSMARTLIARLPRLYRTLA